MTAEQLVELLALLADQHAENNRLRAALTETQAQLVAALNVKSDE